LGFIKSKLDLMLDVHRSTFPKILNSKKDVKRFISDILMFEDVSGNLTSSFNGMFSSLVEPNRT